MAHAENDQNEPSRNEVFGEMFKSRFIRETAAKYVAKTVAKVGSIAKTVAKCVTNVTFYTTSALVKPYVIPTAIRSSKENGDGIDYNKMTYSDAMVTGIGLFLLSCMSYTYQSLAYAYFSISTPSNDHEGHPEVLLIPLATNVVSGIYEVGRSMYKDAKQRLVDKQNLSDLEVSVQDANQSPSDITSSVLSKHEDKLDKHTLDFMRSIVKPYDPNLPPGKFYG